MYVCAHSFVGLTARGRHKVKPAENADFDDVSLQGQSPGGSCLFCFLPTVRTLTHTTYSFYLRIAKRNVKLESYLEFDHAPATTLN